MKTIVFGPPGTGKTHTLLEKVDEYLKTTNPDRIGYFAFTKKAANEAKERAMKKFNLEELLQNKSIKNHHGSRSKSLKSILICYFKVLR